MKDLNTGDILKCLSNYFRQFSIAIRCLHYFFYSLDGNDMDEEGAQILGRGLVHCSALQSIK